MKSCVFFLYFDLFCFVGSILYFSVPLSSSPATWIGGFHAPIHLPYPFVPRRNFDSYLLLRSFVTVDAHNITSVRSPISPACNCCYPARWHKAGCWVAQSGQWLSRLVLVSIATSPFRRGAARSKRRSVPNEDGKQFLFFYYFHFSPTRPSRPLQ